jgi:hypothetical protein
MQLSLIHIDILDMASVMPAAIGLPLFGMLHNLIAYYNA